jgi:hypothetical protein
MNRFAPLILLLMAFAIPATPTLADKPVDSLNGASFVDDSDTVHLMVVLPPGYEKSEYCQKLRSVIEKPTDPRMQKLMGEMSVRTLTTDHPAYAQSWRHYVPEVAKGKPVIVMQQGSKLLGKVTAPEVRGLGLKLESFFGRRKCPNGICPTPQPQPTPQPEPEPTPEPLPDTDPEPAPEPVANNEPNQLAIAMLCIFGSVGMWLVMFRRGQRYS